MLPANFYHRMHASTRTINSRRLKADAISTEDGQLQQIFFLKKKGEWRNECVCMCENIWATVARPLHIE